MLVDRREQPVQGQDVVAALGEATADNHKHARRTAVLATSALHTRQIKRTALEADLRIFETEAEALAWLLAD